MLVSTSLVPVIIFSGTAHADVSCSPNGVFLSGSSWLSGSGVNVCNNGSSSLDDYGASCVYVSGASGGSGCQKNYVFAADEWQCVELVNRLYLTSGWTTATWSGNGNTLVNNVPSSLTKQNNGSISYVNPGDVITLNYGTYGHAAIINSIDGNGTLHIINQNTSSSNMNSSATLAQGTSLSAGNASYNMVSWNGYTVQAIIHHPSNAPPPPPWNGVSTYSYLDTDRLTPGQTMQDQYILSGNAQYALIMQSDGNLAEYHGTSSVWASNTSGNSGAYLGVQSDGNVVVYSSSGHALWNTQTSGQSLSDFIVQSDGNTVAYNTSNQAVWNSVTGGNPTYSFVGSNLLNDGQTLTSGNYILSSDGRYALLMQTDGNLVMYGPGYHVLWASNTSGYPGAYLGLQSDGNMVVYDSSGHSRWASNTGGQSLSYLIMQTDGNLVAYNTSNTAIWSSQTSGKI